MKQLILITIFFQFAYVYVTAQQDEAANRRFLNQATSNMMYTRQYEDIQGSPFLYDQWMKGKIYLNDGASFNTLRFKFDAYNNKFIVNKNDTSFETSPAVQQVQLYLSDDTSNVLTFRKGFAVNADINENKFIQVLASGKITLLKRNSKKLEEYTEYGNAAKLKRFHTITQYFVSGQLQYQEVTLTKKNLENLLSVQWPQVQAYLTKNKLNGKDEKSWSAAINYFNSLK